MLHLVDCGTFVVDIGSSIEECVVGNGIDGARFRCSSRELRKVDVGGVNFISRISL